MAWPWRARHAPSHSDAGHAGFARHAGFALFVLFFTLPLAVLLGYALAPGWTFPDILPRDSDPSLLWRVLGLDVRGGRGGLGGQGAEMARHLAQHLGWSVGTSLLTVLVTLAMCLAPARLFARREFRGKAPLEALLLAPALVPPMTFSMGAHYLFLRLGLADTLAGVVLVLSVFSYPYMLRALVNGYESFGEEFELCAVNLGAGPWTRLWRVELPLLLPALLAGGSVVFLVAFSEYFLVFLIGGGSVPSFTGYLFPFLTSSNRGLAAVLTLVFLVPPIALFLLVETTLGGWSRRRGLG